MTDREPAPLISREVLFGNPDRASARLSPDGASISYLAPVDGVLNIWVGPAEDHGAARPVTNDRERGIRIYFWAFTNRHVLYLRDKRGDEDWHVYSVDLTSGQTNDLTPMEGVNAQIEEISHKLPDEVVLGLNDRNAEYHDLYRVNIATGERILIQTNEEYAGFLADDDYNVRLAFRFTPDGGNETLVPTADGGWEQFMKVDMDDALTTLPAGFDKTGRVLYMIDSRGRDTAALTCIDLDTGEETLLAQDPKADVSDVLLHPTEKSVQAVAFTHQRKQWQVLDDDIVSDFEYLHSVADDEMEVVSRSLDDTKWIVAYVMDDGPVRYYRYHRDRQESEFLFTNREDLEGLTLAKMHPVVINTRDGLDMVCYYTLPVVSSGDGGSQPDRPLPMVLEVHGGPWARDSWGYEPTHQWLANRGYAVLSVNFRGSTGLGKGFANAGNLEWGRKMHDDLIDAVRWAVDEGIADPERIAISGGSYGGYATLVGLTLTPDIFACGVDLVGLSDLVTMVESSPPYWKPLLELEATRIGDSRTTEGRALLAERSPLGYVDRIKRPLLIGHGANDPRVKQAESDQIVRAMQQKNIPVTYLLYPDEGRGFGRPENALSFNAVAEAFLAEHLGGRFQPIGDDFAGSSITAPTGADQVPGLSDALAGC